MDRLPVPADVSRAVSDELEQWRAIVARIDDAELVRSSGCVGWSAAQLVCHVRFDGEALLQGFATACGGPSDRDYVSYWTDWPYAGPATFADVRWSWATSSAYATAAALREHFDDVVNAAIAAAKAAAAVHVRFQGHVMSADDFLAMWATELAIHHLDLLVALPDRPPPEEAALAIGAQTVDGLLGRGRVEGWDDATYLRKATGRASLAAREVVALGDHASQIPVFG